MSSDTQAPAGESRGRQTECDPRDHGQHLHHAAPPDPDRRGEVAVQCTETSKPLRRPPFTMVHNDVIDKMMPDLSPNAFKVLMVAIRQTLGWKDESTASGRKESDVISYSQFMEKTGIRSRSTLSKAIKECVSKGYLVRTEVPTKFGKPTYAYSLKSEYEVAAPENTAGRPGTETELPGSNGTESGLACSTGTGPELGTEVGPAAGTECGHTKETTKETEIYPTTNKQAAAVGCVGESFDLLSRIGVTARTARELATHCPADHVRGWVEYAEGQPGLSNPAGYVVKQLTDGEPPPPRVTPAMEAPGDREDGWDRDTPIPF